MTLVKLADPMESYSKPTELPRDISNDINFLKLIASNLHNDSGVMIVCLDEVLLSIAKDLRGF